MNEVERIVRERAEAYIAWIAAHPNYRDTAEAFIAFCGGWRASNEARALVGSTPEGQRDA